MNSNGDFSQIDVKGRTREECIARILELDVAKQYLSEKTQIDISKTKSEFVAEIDPISFFLSFLFSAKAKDEKFFNDLFFKDKEKNPEEKEDDSSNKRKIKYYPPTQQRKLNSNAEIVLEKLKKINHINL